MSVIYNTQRLESNLRGKSKSICYHEIRESAAMGESLMTRIQKNENTQDRMTKVLADKNR